jgi:hypothetical protein
MQSDDCVKRQQEGDIDKPRGKDQNETQLLKDWKLFL